MPRPKKPGGPEPKKRSRNGCWPCKTRKIKCGEEKPKCQNCERQGETCDYSIRLNWEGRTKRKSNDFTPEPAFRITTPNSAGQPGTLSRTPSENSVTRPVFETTNIKVERSTSNGSLNSPILKQRRNHDSIGDAYAQEIGFAAEIGFATNRRETPADQPHVSPFRSPPAGGTMSTEPKLPQDANVGATHTDVLSRASIPDISYMGITGGQRRGFRDPISASQLSRIRDQSSASYPSPADSGMDSPPLANSVNYNQTGPHPSNSNPQMPPPLQSPFSFSTYSSISRRDQDEMPLVGEHRSKRLRMSPLMDPPDNFQRSQPISYSNYNGGSSKVINSHNTPQLSSFRSYSPSNNYGGLALTPASSSVASEVTHMRSIKPSPQVPQESPDLRRLSVSSLLSPPGPDDDPLTNSRRGSTTPTSPSIKPSEVGKIYGLDRGFPDLDRPNNNDSVALNGLTPSLSKVGLCYTDAEIPADDPPEFGFGLHAGNTAHGDGGYYARPVTVTIPKSLGDLPSELQENPMNLLYFHHFLNHTARILVPHDCSENPFKSILPQMAVGDSNLLHLLLAYSSSHRARLLKHREPANRIAHWVENVFPALRQALAGPAVQISDANLATAIMLASLEIISPNTFEVPVSWQNHLNVARRMILARGGAGQVHRKDRVLYFLSRWFAYLDVLGSLSGGKNEQPLFSGNYWTDNDGDDEQDYQIDCMMGFTSRCVGILAKVAELARWCDSERIDFSGNLREGWRPPPHITSEAEKLKQDLQDARTHRYSGYPHRHSANETQHGWDSLEMVATNDAFHWAGQIHLNRRVLCKNSADPEVQTAVREIVGALNKVRKGGTAEACLLFPMFTAGCDAQEPLQREIIMERLKAVEGSGMTQVNKARRLMEKVWETGRPWETLVSGEFFG